MEYEGSFPIVSKCLLGCGCIQFRDQLLFFLFCFKAPVFSFLFRCFSGRLMFDFYALLIQLIMLSHKVLGRDLVAKGNPELDAKIEHKDHLLKISWNLLSAIRDTFVVSGMDKQETGRKLIATIDEALELMVDGVEDKAVLEDKGEGQATD